MGALIKGDPRGETLYTIREIAQATGMKEDMLHSRRRSWGIPNAREQHRAGYTYEEVQQMIQKPRNRQNREYSKARAAELARRLKTDGFTAT